MMKLNVDLRYGVPAVISLIFAVLQSEDKPLIQHDYLGITSLVLAIVILVFLFTSVNLRLTVEVVEISLVTPKFSLCWTLSVLTSLIFRSSHFWLLFPILVIISHWEGILLGLVLKFYNTLQALPARVIHCFPERQEESEPPPPQGEIEVIIHQNEREQRAGTYVRYR